MPGLQLICSFNPVSKVNWVYKRWFAEQKEYPNTMILHTNYKHNRFLPPEYIAALEDKQKTNPNYYKIYALGEFCTLDRLVYNNWRVEDFDYQDIKGELLVGLDFGFVTDISALVASIIQESEKKIWVFQTWGDTGKTNEELAAIIKSLGFAKSVIVADSAEQKSIEELKRCGITRVRASKKGPDSIIHGIQKLQNYEIIVHPSCDGIITEFENYSWQRDKQTGEYINKPKQNTAISEVGSNSDSLSKNEKPVQTVKPTETVKPTPTVKPEDNTTIGQKNALKSAKQYLSFMGFSREGLIDQLEYEQYSREDAIYAVDNCGADWKQQAVKCAKDYLKTSAFSHDGLVEQLEYEKFTSEEAQYGADNCGADWNEQAVRCAKQYLSFTSMSRNGLIQQLEFEKFTHEQAVYGAEQNGY